MPGRAIRIADLLLEAAPTLDGLAGHAHGHAMRTCYLTMRLAEAMSISDRDRLGLFYAARTTPGATPKSTLARGARR